LLIAHEGFSTELQKNSFVLYRHGRWALSGPKIIKKKGEGKDAIRFSLTFGPNRGKRHLISGDDKLGSARQFKVGEYQTKVNTGGYLP
jgi:hypothetical protein